jgi:hypothetical protein
MNVAAVVGLRHERNGHRTLYAGPARTQRIEPLDALLVTAADTLTRCCRANIFDPSVSAGMNALFTLRARSL